MKTALSLLIVSVSTVSFAQNLNNNIAIHQQSRQFNNVMTQNNVGSFTTVQQVSNPPINVRQVPNVINRRNRSTGPNGTSNPAINNYLLDNVGKNDVAQTINTEKVRQEKETSQASLNLNVKINLPSMSLNKAKEEKRAPKKLDDYRIKTGNGSASSGSSHKARKSKKSVYKKIIKPVKYWWRKNFKHNIKFQSSNDCFLF